VQGGDEPLKAMLLVVGVILCCFLVSHMFAQLRGVRWEPGMGLAFGIVFITWLHGCRWYSRKYYSEYSDNLNQDRDKNDNTN